MRLWLSILLVVAAALPLRAADLVSRVPADSLVVILGSPERLGAAGAPAPTSAPRFGIEQLVALAAQLHILPEQARTVADVVACLPLLGRYRYAFALLDVSSMPLVSGSYRLEQLQAAIVFDTAGDEAMIASRIRQLLTSYASAELGRLDRTEIEGRTRYSLRDSRLPPWVVIEWASFGEEYVVTIGQGAFERMMDVRRDRRQSLAANAWFLEAHRRLGGADAFFECLVAFSRLRSRLGEVVKGRPEEVLKAIGADRAEQMLWTIGRQGRAVTARMIVRTGQTDEGITISAPLDAADEADAVPPEAQGYAAFTFPLGEWVVRGRNAYLASQSAEARAALREGWEKLEERYGFDVDRDLLAHLGGRFVVHDFPAHPLRIPMLWTFLIETDGAEDEVRRAVNGMMQAWQEGLPREGNGPSPTGTSGQLRRTEDGIWYFQLGLAGPAVGVKGRWLIVSFSPAAVRENLRRIAPAASQPAAGPSR